MKQKGFTLIELLAVIVILAVIMLIVTPMVLKTIEDARQGSFKNSAYGIIQTAEYEYSRNIVKKITPSEIRYEYENGKEISTPDGYKLDYKGTKPQNGTVVVNSEGKVAIAIHDGTYCVEKGYEDSEVELSEKTPDDCEIPIPPFPCGEDFVDSRDGEVYKTAQFGDYCWMAEDLRYDCSKAGKGYINVGSGTSWEGTNNCGNQEVGYKGLFYQWPVVMNGSAIETDNQGLCPAGWHIPTDEEWKKLEGTVDSTYGEGHTEWDKTAYRGSDVGTKLKGNPFNAKLAGYRHASGSFSNVGSNGYWWTSSPDGSVAWRRHLDSRYSTVTRLTDSQAHGYSIRCVSEQ